MRKLSKNINRLKKLERIAEGNTCLHRLHPAVKLLLLLCWIICILSVGRLDLSRLIPYAALLLIFFPMAEISLRGAAVRAAAALPFCLLAGLSNLFFQRETVLMLGNIPISEGFLSLTVLLLKGLLTVSGLVLLSGITPFYKISEGLRWLRIPPIFILLIEMTYRYLGSLMKELDRLSTAYSLRGGARRGGIDIRHAGAFIGQLFLRSYDRASRVFDAMCCRGFGEGGQFPLNRQPVRPADWAVLASGAAVCLLLRLFDLAALIGSFM